MLDEAATVGNPVPGHLYGSLAPAGKGRRDEAVSTDPGRAEVAGFPDEPVRLLPTLLADLGLSSEEYMAALVAGRRNGTDAASELLADGRITETDLAVALGFSLRLPAERILAGDIPIAEGSAGPNGQSQRFLRTSDGALRAKIFIAPKLEELDATARFLAGDPRRRSLARITTAGELARHRAAASVGARSEAARLSLSKDRLDASARQVLTGGQGFVLGAVLLASILLGLASPTLFLAALHLVGLPLFSGCVVLRFGAAAALRRRRTPLSASIDGEERAAAGGAAPHRKHPVYSVLVALHRESDVVGDLVAALTALRWPRSRLDIKLVCEGDDASTLAAVSRAIAGKPEFSLVVVPPSLPRTKPKALNFALPLASGDFLVIYDAEDRPDPGQLEAAWRAFRNGEEGLACLQAPLVVRNGRESWLAGHFTLEYAALFRGFLPWLASKRLPLPLGGTSNHFRKDALLAIGGWDSHNVTEDADLGMRLCRGGYRIDTIEAPTYEDAPERWRDWRNQRTRWMKGWLQTWLVHMRNPVQLARDLGLRGFLAFQLLFFGMIASSMVHPLFAVFLGYTVWTMENLGQADFLTEIMIAADLLMLALGYLAFAWLAIGALERGERRSFLAHLLSLHVYWLLISLAAVRAVGQLVTSPHRWEKTPHGPSSRAHAAPVRREPIFDVTESA